MAEPAGEPAATVHESGGNAMRTILTMLLAGLLLCPAALAQPAQLETAQQRDQRMQWWRDARFGMFIHWGPVSLTGHEIGWSRGAQTPIEEYDNLYKKFNPTKFNADEWVAVAKAAGMKYMVLTTKHHDGFCLWDTKETDYNIMNTPFKRDVVKELSAACKKGGIAFGTYYSTCDWHHPAFPLGSPGGSSKKPNPDLKAYDAYLQAQVTELVKNFGPLFTLWFDVPQSYDQAFGIPMVNMLRKLQPDLMINNRAYSVAGKGSGIGHQLPIGDYDTPEQSIGGFNMDRPWETCMTICEQWAWKPNDRMKSLEECIHTLIRTNGGDGNLLFNIGPQPDGLIEPRQVERLREMGAWLEKNSAAVYGTRGGPWKSSSHMASTRKGDRIYLHLLRKTDGPVTVTALPVAIKSARLLNGPAIKTSTADDLLTLEIPDGSWDEIDTIIEITIGGDSMDIALLPEK
jgi:alpha-L-fucosidase